MLKSIRFFAFFLFLPCISFAQQQIVFDRTTRETVAIKYVTVPEPREVISNYIIQEIAKAIPKILFYTEIKYSFLLQQQILKLDNNQYRVVVKMNQSSCSGDLQYKGFDISAAACPVLCDYSVNVWKAKGGQPQTYSFQNIVLQPESTQLAFFTFSDTLPNPKFELETASLKVYYDAGSKQRFDEKTRLIDAYYLSDMELSKGFSKLQLINLGNVDMLTVYDFQLREIEKIVADLNAWNFPTQLNLNQFDPISFNDKMANLNRQTWQTRESLNQLLATLDQVFYNKGLEYLGRGQLNQAEHYFNRSLETNPYYTPAHYQLARMNFNRGDMDGCAAIINSVLTQMKPDYTTYGLLLDLANATMATYMARGTELNQQEKYTEAIVVFSQARKFCMTTPGILCTDEVHASLARAKYGLYSSYLRVAERALEQNKLEMSESYVKEAEKYQKENSSEIINDSEVKQLYSRLADAWAIKGEQENQNQNFDKALEYLTQAARLCNLTPGVTCSERVNSATRLARKGIYDQLIYKAWNRYKVDDAYNAEIIANQAVNYQKSFPDVITSTIGTDTILGKIKFKIYNELIYNGKQSLGMNRFDEALNRFNEARKLESQYVFKRNKSLDSLLSVAAKPVLLDKIEQGKLNAWANELEKARDIYASVQQEQQQYNLLKDRQLNTELDNLRLKIFDRECLNLQNQYDEIYRSALRKVNEKDFIAAGDEFDKAINTARSKPECKVSEQLAFDSKLNYMPAITYQKLIREALNAVNASNYALAQSTYEKAFKYYDEFEVNKYNLAKETLSEWAYKLGNQKFLAWLVNFYTDSGELNVALEILKTLRARNFPQNYSIDIQTKLGKSLAIRDKDNPAINYKLNLQQYTGNDKWFKPLNKSYLKTYKSKQ